MIMSVTEYFPGEAQSSTQKIPFLRAESKKGNFCTVFLLLGQKRRLQQAASKSSIFRGLTQILLRIVYILD